MSRHPRNVEAQRGESDLQDDAPAPASTTADLRLGVVILGAGASQRMGRPKLLLPWGATTVLGQLLHQWHHLGAEQVAVVHSTHDRGLIDELDRLHAPHRIPNPDPARGMFGSIHRASAWNAWNDGLTHWAIVLGDQPHLNNRTLRTLLTFAAGNADKICQPRQGGHGRHPVLLPQTAFRSLSQSPHPSLKAYLKAAGQQVLQCPIDDPDLALDMDYPRDYQQALQLAGLTPSNPSPAIQASAGSTRA